MARMNAIQMGGAVAVGALATAVGRFGDRIPVIGPQLTQFGRPGVGVAAIAALVLAPDRMVSRWGLEGAAHGGGAILGEFVTNWVLDRALGAGAFATRALGVGIPAHASIGPAVEDLLNGGPSARVRTSPAGIGMQTVKIDM